MCYITHSPWRRSKDHYGRELVERGAIGEELDARARRPCAGCHPSLLVDAGEGAPSPVGTIRTQGAQGTESTGYGTAVAIRGRGDARVFAQARFQRRTGGARLSRILLSSKQETTEPRGGLAGGTE